ncbi:MAG: phosphotransferase [Actinoallomurus sp.]
MLDRPPEISSGVRDVAPKTDGTTVILRRPPLGGVLPSAHELVREYRVITALGDTDVPVPRTLALNRPRTLSSTATSAWTTRSSRCPASSR